MYIFKCIRAVINFYMRYVQPLLGLCLVLNGLWILYSSSVSPCMENNLESCTTSGAVIIRASLYLVIGIAVVAVWFFTEVHPKQSGEDQENKVKSGVKPEDFVK